MNNVVRKFKKGHKIHIKESLEGSFTRWCGGNVTNECILRGKNSSNPKIRKKATFAANARKWNHKDGGQLKGKNQPFVKGVSVLDSNPDAYKYVKKKYKMRSAQEGANTSTFGLKVNKVINSKTGQFVINNVVPTIINGIALKNKNNYEKEMSDAAIDAEFENKRKMIGPYSMLMANLIIQLMYRDLYSKDPENYNPNAFGGSIFALNIAYNLGNEMSKEIDEQKRIKKMLNQLLNDTNDNDMFGNLFLQVANFGLESLSKNSTPKSTSTPTSISTPTSNFSGTTTNFGNVGTNTWNGSSVLFTPNKLYNFNSSTFNFLL